MKIIRMNVGTTNLTFNVVQDFTALQRDKSHAVIEMVEDNDISIKDIVNIRCIILIHGFILHIDVLEIANCIECCVSVKTAVGTALPFHMKMVDEIRKSIRHSCLSLSLRRVVYRKRLSRSVRICCGYDSVSQCKRSNGMNTNKRPRIFA